MANGTAGKPRVGLVLSGGGAKGAYQVGVLKALAELNVEVHAVAGASIGALNGLVVATSPSLKEAAAVLEAEWTELIGNSPIEFKIDMKKIVQKAHEYFMMTNAPKLPRGLALKWAGTAATPLGRSILLGGLFLGLRDAGAMEGSWAEADDIEATVERYLSPSVLAKGLPLYVSLFESQGGIEGRADIIRKIFGMDTRPSEAMHVQKLAPEDQRRAILASAAIPTVLPAREIQGKRYVDGGMGGNLDTQGNTPADPLIRDSHCTHVIVTHLFDGATWRRDRFDATILEIRPGESTGRHEGILGYGGDFLDMLNFTDAIPSWIEQGYQDTLRCVGQVQKSLGLTAASANAEAKRDAALSELADDDFSID